MIKFYNSQYLNWNVFNGYEDFLEKTNIPQNELDEILYNLIATNLPYYKILRFREEQALYSTIRSVWLDNYARYEQMINIIKLQINKITQTTHNFNVGDNVSDYGVVSSKVLNQQNANLNFSLNDIDKLYALYDQISRKFISVFVLSLLHPLQLTQNEIIHLEEDVFKKGL